MLLWTVHWWPAPISVGGLREYITYPWHSCYNLNPTSTGEGIQAPPLSRASKYNTYPHHFLVLRRLWVMTLRAHAWASLTCLWHLDFGGRILAHPSNMKTWLLYVCGRCISKIRTRLIRGFQNLLVVSNKPRTQLYGRPNNKGFVLNEYEVRHNSFSP